MKKLKLFFACLLMAVLSIGQVWGEVVSGTTYDVKASTSIPSGWTASGNFATSGGGWLYLTYADNYVQTDEFCQNGFTSIKIKARKYGGPSDAQGVISVEWFEKGGSSTVLATTTPSGTGLADITLSDLATVTGNKEGYIKISCKGASSNKGSGISEVTITYTSGNCAVADPYTVSFSTGAGNPSVASQTETAGGAGITLPAGPTPTCSADGWMFAGWAEAVVASQTTTAPTLFAAGTNYKPSDDVTLFAVYKKTETGDVTDLDKTEGFEAKAASTTYNSTVTISEAESDCGIGWSIYFGTVATNDKIAGNNSGHMRWYSTSTSSLPYAKTTTAISGLQSVNFKARVSNTAVKMSLWYSTNGEDWTLSDVNQETFTAANTAYDFSATISGTVGTNYYVKIGEDGGTAPSSGNYKLIIDAVQFNYKAGASTTYYLSAPSCCEKHAITIATGIENGSVEADLAEACEGTAVTLTFTPALNYHLSAWTLNGDDQDIAENTFEMPGADVTVSATFAQDACEPLGTPSVTVSGKEYPYDAVQLAWTAIEHADAYKVYIYDAEDNEIEKDEAFTGIEYTIGHTLSASTTYKYSVQAISNTPATYCPSTEAASTFVTDALPTAHLTLIALGEEHASSGDYAILTPFNLPATAAACSKAFVGWDPALDCSSAPAYAKGAEFTFANTTGITLYAVYADETPGAAALTKLGSSYVPAAGDNLVIVGVDTDDDSEHALYQETSGSSYVKHWTFDNDVATVAADAKKYVTLEAATDGKFYLGDATNGYVYSSGSNNLSVDLSNKTAWTIAWDNEASAFTFNQGKYLSCRKDLTGENKYLYRLAGGTPAGIYKLDVYKYAVSASTYSNYATTCVASPTATPAAASVEIAQAGGSSTLGVTYENVNLAGVTVALYNNAACTEAFVGGWLTAEIEGEDKHIAYTAQANTTSYDARTAYIKLTAPETNGAASPAVVVIPVTQAKYIPAFASLEELVAAELPSGTSVTVTFSNVLITEVQTTTLGYRYGLYLNVKDKDGENDIELFYNKQGETMQVPAAWVKNGTVSATSLAGTWTFFSGTWELAMQATDWTWADNISYTAPKAVSSVVVSGTPDKTSYVDGEAFKPAGLIVTVNYTVGDPEVIDAADAEWEFTPAKLAKGNTSVSVKATYNSVQSEAFVVNGLTVGDIQPMDIADFIAAGGARCYLEGIVGTIDNNTYGNFWLTDASGSIYVYGCLTSTGESGKFNTLGVVAGDKIKVIAEEYKLYKKSGDPDKDEAIDVQFVSKKPVATMTFDDLALEFGDEETLAPKTITLADASDIVYSIKEGSDDCVTILNDKITAKSVAGSATIVATLAETEDYVGTTAEFAVTVTAPDTRLVANGSAFTAVSGDLTPADIKFAANQGDGTTTPIISSEKIRLYKPASGKTTGGYLTLTALIGYKIDQVQITFDGNATASYAVDDAAFSDEAFISGQATLLTPTGLEAQSVSIVNLKNGSIDISAIKVWYTGSPLSIDHYFVTGTYATEFEQYGTFDYSGLQVFAAYDAGETITEEIFGFTVEADLTTAGSAKANVMLNSVKIVDYDITVTASSKQYPALAYDPTSDEITLGDAWTAPTFSNPLSVEGIVFATSNSTVAKVSNAGVVTLQGGCGEAVITATFAATAEYAACVATYTITVNEPAEVLDGKWELVNEVLPGMRIIIANEASAGAIKTMGMQNSNNRAAVASSVDANGVLTPAAGTKTFLVVDAGNGEFALQARNGNYLYAASSSSNHLKETNDLTNVNTKWTITFDNNSVATIKALHEGHTSVNWIRYNTSGLFSCYGATNNQEDVYVYAWKPYTRTVSGNYGTICLPNGGVMTNATIYTLAYFGETSKKIFFDEVLGGVMEAGKPYLFLPNDGVNEIKVVYTDAAGESAKTVNGFVGYIGASEDPEDALQVVAGEGNYIVQNNTYREIQAGAVAKILSHRAYIHFDGISTTEPAKAPGARRIGLGKDEAQGFENLQSGDQPMKVMIDGTLYIIRGEKVYNANGQVVK